MMNLLKFQKNALEIVSAAMRYEQERDEFSEGLWSSSSLASSSWLDELISPEPPLVLEELPEKKVSSYRPQKNKQSKWGVLELTEKEVSKMPKQFRRDFRVGKIVAHVRQKNNGVFEIRCQINKQKIYAASKLLDDAKRKFIEALNGLASARPDAHAHAVKIKKSITLGEYMLKWLEMVKKPSVKPITYKDYMLTYTANICPIFGDTELNQITQFDLQGLINSYTEQGKNRTAKKVFQLLTSVFEYAVVDELITKTPMQRVVLPRYEQERGTPLSLSEEKELVNALRAGGDIYTQASVFLLYTGLRRSELATVVVDGGWVYLNTSKQRKGYKQKQRSIPVSPMLAPLLPFIDIQALTQLPVALLTKYFKRRMPTHHLHDTRHTFITRAQECGIRREIVSLWAGHAADSSTTTTVYTHLEHNKELQEIEMRKFSYNL